MFDPTEFLKNLGKVLLNMCQIVFGAVVVRSLFSGASDADALFYGALTVLGLLIAGLILASKTNFKKRW